VNRWRVVTACCAVFAAAGVSSALSGSRIDGATVASPVRVVPLNSVVNKVCARAEVLRTTCPTKLPAVGDGEWTVNLCRPNATGCAGVYWYDLELDAGLGTQPPTGSHVAVFVGARLRGTHAFPFAWPPPKPRQIGKTLKSTGNQHAAFLGFAWHAGHRGQLILAPSYPAGGEQGDHVVFLWTSGGMERAVGLHSWGDVMPTIATLRRMLGLTATR
jgi:hypothetical protein